jgi:DNA-binding NarL/FixJ family response regulator
MVAIAVYSADSKLRHRLQQQLSGAPGLTIAGVAADLPALDALLAQSRVDVVLADALRSGQLVDWHARHTGIIVIVLADQADSDLAVEALHAGAAAVLPRAVDGAELAAAIEAASRGFAILPRDVLAVLMDAQSVETGEPPVSAGLGAIPLTARELEVLAAMADGASNKAIARRLGISFHTAKFHVAAILAKLDADSRTEAVAKAAHLGLVML